MTNLDQFIIHSAYPVEKIVWSAQGVFDQSNPHWSDFFDGYVFEPLPDEIDATDILIDGVWTNDDWNTQYPINTNSLIVGFEGSPSTGYSPEFDSCDVVVFEKGVEWEGWGYIVPYKSVGIRALSASRRVEYRLWAYMVESEWDTPVHDKTAEALAHSFQKNTNLAQLNMISENILSIPSGQTRVLQHNLGFRPYCKMWRRIGGFIQGDTWQKNNLHTVYSTYSPYRRNDIRIDTEKITIYAEDPQNNETQDFLIRIFNYAIPV